MKPDSTIGGRCGRLNWADDESGCAMLFFGALTSSFHWKLWSSKFLQNFAKRWRCRLLCQKAAICGKLFFSVTTWKKVRPKHTKCLSKLTACSWQITVFWVVQKILKRRFRLDQQTPWETTKKVWGQRIASFVGWGWHPIARRSRRSATGDRSIHFSTFEGHGKNPEVLQVGSTWPERPFPHCGGSESNHWTTRMGNPSSRGVLTRPGAIWLPPFCIDGPRFGEAALHFLRKFAKMAWRLVRLEGHKILQARSPQIAREMGTVYC